MKKLNYSFRGMELRAFELETGELYYCVIDVCKIMQIKTHQAAGAKVDKKDKMLIEMENGGGKHPTLAVNTYGLQEIVFSKVSKEVDDQKRWFNEFVITPNILKGRKDVFGNSISELFVMTGAKSLNYFNSIKGKVKDYNTKGLLDQCPTENFLNFYDLKEGEFKNLDRESQHSIMYDLWSKINAAIEVADECEEQLKN